MMSWFEPWMSLWGRLGLFGLLVGCACEVAWPMLGGFEPVL